MTLAQTPEFRGASLTEDFSRQMGGMQPMEGIEADRFARRWEQDQQRGEDIGTLQQGAADQSVIADEISGSLRRAGLSDVAERYRRASQQQAFNAARRGLTGGSYDVEAQADIGGQAQMGAQDVAAQAEQARIAALMQQMQTAGSMEQSMMGMSPFEQQMLGSEQQMTQQMMQQQHLEQQMQQQLAAARARQTGAIGGGIGSALAGMGNVGMAGLIRSA